MITEKTRQDIFDKCRKVPGLSEDTWRLDAADAIIKRTSYGCADELYGWEIDHVVPRSLLEEHKVPEDLIDDEQNLRAMNWNNNRSKSDSYPSYKIVVTSSDDGSSNIFIDGNKTVNKSRQQKLRELYKDYFNEGEL
jgi:hypothetical protein